VAGCSAHAPEVTASDGELTLEELPIAIAAPVAATFDQTLDHDAASSPVTFKQRYWYTTEFANGPASPVLYYFCGEQTCGTWALERMADTAKSLHAVVIALEHRYYGSSRPFDGELTSEKMKYLSVHQALEDAATFEAHAKTALALEGKWISVGGSYSGMLAAFYRDKHPEAVVGAWASSAPVDVRRSFWGGDALSARALGPTCLALFQNALATASAAYDDPNQRNALSLALYGTEWKDGWGKGNFLGSISGAARGAAQGGDTARLCQSLQQHLDRPIDGIAAYYNPPLVPDDTPAPANPAAAAAAPDDAIGPGENTDDQLGRLWFYQVCTEMGFYEVKNPDRTLSIMSDLSPTEEEQDQRCVKLYQRKPDIDATRATYFEPLRTGHVSNILYVNGSYDPWSSLSFNDPNQPPPGATVFVIQQGAHHDELTNLQPDSPIPVFEAHVLFNKLAKKWLAE
jgi:hypothetical protein